MILRDLDVCNYCNYNFYKGITMKKILVLVLVMASLSFGRGFLPSGTGKAAFFVAASNATDKEKRIADYQCDGTADDVQIQAAISALPTGGGKVVLSAGIFYVAAPLQLYRNIQDFSLELIGAGIGNTTITQKDGANLASIIACNPSGAYSPVFICVRDMTVSGNGTANTTTSGIVRTNVGGDGSIFDFRIENVMVIRCPKVGISLASGWGDQLVNCITEFNGSRGLYINAGSQIYVENLFSAYNGYDSASTDDGAGIYATCDKSVFNNMVVYHNAGDGIFLSVRGNNSFNNVLIDQWGNDGHGKTQIGSSALYVNNGSTNNKYNNITILQSTNNTYTYRAINCLGAENSFNNIEINRWGTRNSAGGAIVIGTAGHLNVWSNILINGQSETNAQFGISCAGDKNIFNGIRTKSQLMNPVVLTADAGTCIIANAILQRGSNDSEEIGNASGDSVIETATIIYY
jgi:hypothetical protein